MTKQEYESETQRITGQRLARVVYLELRLGPASDDSTVAPFWNWDQRFDSLDFGLLLQTMSGEGLYITWGWEFEQYGVSLQLQPDLQPGVPRMWDVTIDSRWGPLIGQVIVNVRVCWSWVDGEIGKTYYPQGLELQFENGIVWCSALEVRPDGSFFGMMDHITVFFDPTIAREFGVCAEHDAV